jgi:hypothetical protein
LGLIIGNFPERLLVLTTTFLPEHSGGENPCRC